MINNVNLKDFVNVSFLEYLLITGEWHRLKNHKYVVKSDYIYWINNKTSQIDAFRTMNETTKIKENYIRKEFVKGW